MTTMAVPPAPTPAPAVGLGRVRRGLVDPADGCRDLDAVLDQAQAAERDGAGAVEVPHGGQHWPATAHALAVLLATATVRVVVPVETSVDVAVLARFAQGATRLAGDRLVVRVAGGPGADAVAARLRARWDGTVAVG